MTLNEITKRIEEIESRRFFLAMKDRWSSGDYDLDRELFRELRQLQMLQVAAVRDGE